MAKRHVTLAEVKALIEQGSLSQKGDGHAWVSHHFTTLGDNVVCAAVLVADAVIVKTTMHGRLAIEATVMTIVHY
jgi:hypothetical protein